MDIQKTLKKHSSLPPLFGEIDEWKSVKLEKGTGDSWGSHIDAGDIAVITYTPTENKATCLAHELLHFKIQKDGYKRLRSVVTSHPDKALVKNLIDALDNELQHHKMYPFYRSMGLAREKFYNDVDKNVSKFLDEKLKNAPKNIEALLLPYLTVSAPGGALTAKQIEHYKKLFREKAADSAVFDTIDEAFRAWVANDSFNVEDVVKKIFSVLGATTCTWVGHDDGSDFPSSGFFIGEPFTIEEFQEKYT